MIDYRNIKINKKTTFKKSLGNINGFHSIEIYGSKLSGPGILKFSIISEDKKIDYDINLQKNFKIIKKINIPNNSTLVVSTNFRGEIILNRLIVKRSDKLNNVFSKKIACIIPYGIYGGAEVYLKNIIEQDIKNKYYIIYIDNNPMENLLSSGNVEHVKCIRFKNFSNVILSFNFDAIIFYNSKMVYNRLISTKAYNSSKIIQIYHSDLKWSDSLPAKKLNYVDSVVKINPLVGRDILKYSLIPPIINTKNFTIARQKRVVGTVARFSQEKNLHYIINIARQLPKYNFVIYGEGPLKKDFLKHIALSNVKNISVENFRVDIYNYYQHFGLFLLTSNIEGLPLTILEAMSCNIPVVAPAVGGIVNLIENKIVTQLTRNSIEDSKIIKENFGKKVETRTFVIENHSFNSIKKEWSKVLSQSSIELRDKNVMEKILDCYYV